MRRVLKVKATNRTRVNGQRLVDLANLARPDHLLEVASAKASGKPSARVAMLRRFDHIYTFDLVSRILTAVKSKE